MNFKTLFLYIITLLINTNITAQSQKYPFDKWDKKELDLANTFSQIDYMDSIEKEVVFLCNLVRINPKLFSQTYLEQFLNSDSLAMNNSYITSLKLNLKKRKKGTPLNPNENCFKMAEDHATNMGIKGKIGHPNYEKRIKTFKIDTKYATGENCSYGYNTAIEIVMQLLIDQGVSALGHRKNILNEDFNIVGVSIKPHKKFEYNCVMIFNYDLKYSKKKK